MITNSITVGHLFWWKYEGSPDELDMPIHEDEHQELGAISISTDDGRLVEHYYDVEGVPDDWKGSYVEHGMTHADYIIQTEEPLTIGDIEVHGGITIEVGGKEYTDGEFSSEVIEGYVV